MIVSIKFGRLQDKLHETAYRILFMLPSVELKTSVTSMTGQVVSVDASLAVRAVRGFQIIIRSKAQARG